MCSQLEVDVQSKDLLVWTMTSNSLQKRADSFIKLCALNVMYSPVKDFCCVKEKLAEMSPQLNHTER